jgi:hypothetical protein
MGALPQRLVGASRSFAESGRVILLGELVKFQTPVPKSPLGSRRGGALTEEDAMIGAATGTTCAGLSLVSAMGNEH